MDEGLRQELIAMRAEDEAVRARVATDRRAFVDDHPEVRATCDRHAERLAEIVRKDGWPKRSEVGEDGAEAAWLVAMNALGRKDYMLAWAWDLAASAQQGEASPTHVALLTDRTRVLRGKEQIYGTQVEWDDAGTLAPLPITQPETVDVRRESVFLEPLAQWLAEVRAGAGEPPADLPDRRRRQDDLLRSTGWRR